MPGGGEMPSGGEMPGGGAMPSGEGQGGAPQGTQMQGSNGGN